MASVLAGTRFSLVELKNVDSFLIDHCYRRQSSEGFFLLLSSWLSLEDRRIRHGLLNLQPLRYLSQTLAVTHSLAFTSFGMLRSALGVQQPSLLGASPTIYTQQTALAAAGLTTQTPANYQLTQTAALQQQAAAAAAALQQVNLFNGFSTNIHNLSRPCIVCNNRKNLQQPQQTLLTQPAVALPTSLSLSTPQPAAQITVSYPAPRSSQQQTQPQKQRVFTGVVTKLHDTFGFVDEDVFFQLSAVKGKTPQVGDRVLVEATYNPNMPFKWNAQRIQTLPNQNQSQTQPLLKTPPAVLQPIAPQTTFGVQAQPQPQSLLQAQISAASITPLLQTQPQPLLQQPQQKEVLLSICKQGLEYHFSLATGFCGSAQGTSVSSENDPMSFGDDGQEH
ncbi:hypothetical protein MC885_003677 [Smutsia gigantea]|nr:hypothetical protein MC885_003677 [Smutsia gigantea]